MLHRRCGIPFNNAPTIPASFQSRNRYETIRGFNTRQQTFVANPLHSLFVTEKRLISGYLLGLTVYLALFPAVRSVLAEMDARRNSQAGLVKYLVQSLRITSTRVEHALLDVDRKYFVDSMLPSALVYKDRPLPIGFNETISAPHMHATCLELLDDYIRDHSRILDVGSGSGYLTSALALMGGPESRVLGIEKHHELAEQSIKNIRKNHPDLLSGHPPRVQILSGNALSAALGEYESFDAIHVGAAAETVPDNLVQKLSLGGRMVIPVGPRSGYQELMCIDKDLGGRVTTRSLMHVRYVPLTKPTEGSGSVSVN